MKWKADLNNHTSKLKPRSGGFASPVDKTLSRAGRPFTRTVLDALSSNRIGTDVAARYLDLKYQHFDTLKKALIIQSGARGSNG